MNRYVYTILIIILGCNLNVSAQTTDLDATTPYHQAVKEYDRGNYEKAFAQFKPLAEQGDTKAQLYLAICYSNGEGVRRNYQEAEAWLKKAATQNDAEAQFELGMFYLDIDSRSKQPEKVIFWLLKAAQQKNVDAQFALGVIYDAGILTKIDGEWIALFEDREKAIYWYEQASEQGDTDAQSNLGLLYLRQKDYTQAHQMYKKAAVLGNKNAQLNLGYLYVHGWGVPQNNHKAYLWISLAATDSPMAREALQNLTDKMTSDEVNVASQAAQSCIQSHYTQCE